MEEGALSRESVEYAEILSEVFAALVERSVGRGGADPEHGLTEALAGGLQYVYLHGSCSIGQVAEGLGISEPAASQLVERLVRRGLIARRVDERDRRSVRVSLTEMGVEAASRGKADRQQAFAQAFDRMDRGARLAFVQGLESFLVAALGDEQEIEQFCARCGIDHVAFCVLNRLHQEVTGSQMEGY